MGIKLLMCFLSVTAGTMTGFYLYKRESMREKYFESLCSLCNHLITDIKFSQRTIEVLINSFMQSRTSPLSQNLNEYLAYIGSGTSELTLTRGLLKPLELVEVKSFFSTLGTLDSETQVFEIEGYKQKFLELKNQQKSKVEKTAKNYTKLGFLLGLAIGILLM